MQQINWDKLGLRGESKQKSFEDLCLVLCCRELKISKINAYQNQPGIETKPFEVNNKKYGFQAKFFDSKFDWVQIKKSIFTAIELYPELDKIYLYSNKNKTLARGTEKTLSEIQIAEKARSENIGIEYITDRALVWKLCKPANLDLAQLFFGLGDEFGFIKSSINTKLLTFIQSTEYLNLPFIDKAENSVNLSEKILENTSQNIFLLTGNPGSGKSVFMHKLLEIFGGLDKQNKNDMVTVLTDNAAIPTLINLKNCINESLESIVRGRKNDSRVNNISLEFIYLLDGLDELNENIADNVLSQIYELTQKSNTKKVIISCRSGNLNKIKAKQFFDDIIEYQIADLDETYLDNYFNSQGNKSKQKKLQILKQKNQSIVSNLKDILLIQLLWDTITELNETSTTLDLFSKKIDLLLESPEHKKNIEELNLLNCKKQEILNLNEGISFEFQKKFQFRFSQEDLQKFIFNQLPRLDYKAVNAIINFIADLFFDKSSHSSDSSNATFIYQHRRYQEYFFTKKLKVEYEKNPQIVRELKLLSNREYFEKLFLPYLRIEYEKENNLSGMVELNLMDCYLGKNDGFAPDDNCYVNSTEFISALVSQNKHIFNELLESENLQIKDKIYIDVQELETQLQEWNKDKNNFHSNDYLEKFWEVDIAFVINKIVLFWKSAHQEVAKNLKQQLERALDLYDKYKFHKNHKERRSLKDPFYEGFEDWVYCELIIEGQDVKQIFINLIRKNYENFSGYHDLSHEESGKEKLVKSFFRVCLKEKQDDLYKLVNDFDEYEFLALLDVFKSIEYLPIFVRSKLIHEKIKSFIDGFSPEIDENNVFILFYKKYFNLSISEKDIQIANEKLKKLRGIRPLFWRAYGTQIDYAVSSYILDKFSFEEFLEKQEEGYSFRNYNELGLYSALFKDFISLLKGEQSIEAIVRNYIRYIDSYTSGRDEKKYLEADISFFWAIIFSFDEDDKKLLPLKNILIKEGNDIVPFDFFLYLNRLVPNRFPQIVTQNELIPIEKELTNLRRDEYFSFYVDRCFSLSMFFSQVDNKKAIRYFEKGIIEGILRHLWRKDIIVSYLLTDALEIIWRNHWVSDQEKEEYVQKVFDLTMRVVQITDGKLTWKGPYLVIEIISKTNIALAEQFAQKLIEAVGYDRFSNRVITTILRAKVNHGVSIKKIEEGMREFRKDYGYEGKPIADYYEQKFILYLEITKSELYTKEEHEEAFLKAYGQIEEIKTQEIDYYLKDLNSKKKLYFQQLCKNYKKKFNLTFGKESDSDNFSSKEKKIISEKEFIKEVEECSTAKQIADKYEQLNDYNIDIVLKNHESWEILVQKTYEINKNLKLFFDFLLNNHFPSTNFFSNSRYLHLPLAVALKDINTRQEALNYLFKNSGYQGFLNIMKAYEVLGDKTSCLNLFNRYLKFCKLLVN